MGDESTMIDIDDGQRVSIQEKKRRNNLALLRLKVNPQDCWVSDLDAYDAVKAAITDHKPRYVLLALCNDYWGKVQPLATYSGGIQRPEVMITQDIAPSAIEKVQ